MKTALVAIVRNEVHDLLAWLAWHTRLGVDSFVIFDDGSDDGTLALLEAATVQHDIRLFRITDAYDSPLERQRIVYLDALYGLKENFDWIGFLDCDEYLALHRHNDLKSFLNSFDDNVGAVGIHWCLYGSNNYITKPDMPPFHAFTRHSPPEHNINRHIKTFLRPETWNKEWENPHFFPLYDKRYVNPEGHLHHWSNVPGITTTNAVWDTARVMHFQTRSLEQFIERTRRHEDISLTLRDFNTHDLNDIQDNRPQGTTPAILSQMQSVVFQGAAEALDALPYSTQQETEKQAEPVLDKQDILSLSWLIPWDKSHIEIHGGWACPQKMPKNKSGLFLLQSSSVSNNGFIFALDHHNRVLDFSILSDSRLTSFLGYDIYHTQTKNQVALRKYGGLSRERRYITMAPDEPLTANRKNVQLWEIFQLTPAPTAHNGMPWQEIALVRFAEEAFQKPVRLSTISHLAQKDRLLTTRLLPLLHAALPKREQNTLEAQLGPFVPFIL